MFKKIFTELCLRENESPTSVCLKLGLSNSTYSYWDDNTIPRKSTLTKIANYFNVTEDYLLGKDATSDEIEAHVRWMENILKQKNGELKLKIFHMQLGMMEEEAELNVELLKTNIEYNEAIKNGMPEKEASSKFYGDESWEEMDINDERMIEYFAKIEYNKKHPEIRLKRIEELKRLLKEE